MHRRQFLKLTATSAAGSFLTGCFQNNSSFLSSATKRPNIIFIMSDDHAYQAISSYGSKLIQTPNIDRLAKEGMLFENSFVTNSICAPSRACILTGKYSHKNGHVNNEVTFDAGQQTLPKLLRAGGYQTAIIGKWHLKSQPTGFDYWKILPGQGRYYDPEFIDMDGQTRVVNGYVTDLITDMSIDWIANRNSDKPFFLMCHHKASHGPWDCAPRHSKLFDNIEFPEPETFNDSFKTRSRAAKECQMDIGKYLKAAFKEDDPRRHPPDGLDLKQEKKWYYQQYMKSYLGVIKTLDESVGRILEYIDENGLADNTIVVYTSDQGFYLGEHGWYDKRFMYEQSLRMPLLIRYPKEIPAQSRTNAMTLNIDFAPTFLDYAGLNIPSDIQGKSLRSILKDDIPDNWRKSLYYHYYEYPGWHSVKRHYGIRTQRYKLMHFYFDIDAWELYDLKNDPKELNNLYGKKEYAQLCKKLKKNLRQLQKKYGDSDELAIEFIQKYPGNNKIKL